ncbi:hypothetical protein HNR23_005003 [Nocardiopsis mwathae]|uniref:SAF domain-containing protein n=1 Tax=Nocardiopsis mwathae TaxID=1472723 RepID=A0A7W9YML1_9ACTN|nr:SAF domain-containing protein [Nocardiopsis mwathae]MBB6174943.1 hypothetical protein [Nocardiopsis mwathae]
MAMATALDQVDQRSGVVVAARTLPAGHVVAQGDLRVAQIAGAEDLAAIPAAQLDALVGQTVLTLISDRALITEEALGSREDHPKDDEAIVGASLSSAQFPSSLRNGAHVSLISTEQGQDNARTDGADDGTTVSAPAGGRAISGQVQSITPTVQGGGDVTLVELVVDRSDAADVARAASAGALTVVAVSSRGR